MEEALKPFQIFKFEKIFSSFFLKHFPKKKLFGRPYIKLTHIIYVSGVRS